MINKKYSHILDGVIREELPTNVDLKERVMSKAGTVRPSTFKPRMKLVPSLIIALAAVVLLSTLGYAIYHWINDPGLQAVQNAGLVTKLEDTAQPTRQPTQKPVEPPAALRVNQSQTVEGVSLNLSWVYLDSTQLLFGLDFSELPANISVGFPVITINEKPLQEGQLLSTYLESKISGVIYRSTQVLQPESVGNQIKLSIEIPLLRLTDGKETQAAVFHFTVAEVPLLSGQTLPIQQTITASVNGKKLQLHSFRMNPAMAEAIVCPVISSETDFKITQSLLSASKTDAITFAVAKQVEVEGYPCQQVNFNLKENSGSGPFTLTVNHDWQFLIDRPSVDQIPGVKLTAQDPTPEPVA